MAEVNNVNPGAPIVESIVDPANKCGRFVDEAHSRIHQGKSFVAGSYTEAVANDAVIDTLIRVGANELHFVPLVAAGGSAVAQLFKDTVVDNEIVITDDAGTWTAGPVVVTINGTEVSQAFDTDKATSMTALAAAIQALAFITTAVYAGGGNTITINPLVATVDLEVAVDVSGITGNMAISSISGGTHLTIFNRKPSSSTVSDAIVKIAPVITSDGTAYPPRWFPGGSGGNAQGGEARGVSEIELSVNTIWLLRVKNLAGSAKTLSALVDFYIEG